MKLMKLYESIQQETLIRSAAWLYIIYIYKSVKFESWKNDIRMGISFTNALEILNKNNLIKIDDDSIHTTNKTEKYLLTVFGKYNSLSALEDDEDNIQTKFSKYDTDKYKISSIPYELNTRILDNEILNTNTAVKIDHEFITWLKKYQRGKIPIPLNLLAKYKNNNTIKQNKDYTLYRGIYINKFSKDYDKFINLSVGDKIKDDNSSWSMSKTSAAKFSLGSTNWMDSTKEKPGDISIILKHTFTSKEVFCDLYFMDKFVDFIDFPEEYEVIIIPKQTKYIIDRIIFH